MFSFVGEIDRCLKKVTEGVELFEFVDADLVFVFESTFLKNFDFE